MNLITTFLNYGAVTTIKLILLVPNLPIGGGGGVEVAILAQNLWTRTAATSKKH